MSNELVYTVIGEICYCGTNNISSKGNAAKNPSQISGKVVIDLKYGNNYVNEIGKAAFFGCALITEVVIKARITKINERAFSDCSGLLRINIPSTVTFIDTYGIHFYIEQTSMSKGAATVMFEDRTNAITIKEKAIGQRETIKVFLPNKIDASCVTNSLYEYKTFVVYSKYSFTFCGIQTLVEPKLFEKKMSCICRRNSFLFSCFSVLVFRNIE